MFTQKASANRRSTPIGTKAMTRGVLNNTYIIAMRKRFLTTIRLAFLYISTLHICTIQLVKSYNFKSLGAQYSMQNKHITH